MNLLLPEEATNFKARSIALASTLKIELDPFISKIVHIYKSIVVIGKHVIFTWIPGHIHGSMGTKLSTGKLIKDALKDSISQLGDVFRVICYEFAGPSCLASVLKYIS
jgi:hypothetical protein